MPPADLITVACRPIFAFNARFALAAGGGRVGFSFPLPPIDLQTVFAEQVHRIEALAHYLDAAAAKAEAMASSLSSEVFDQARH